MTDQGVPAQPLLSVVVAAHNAEPWIGELLESVGAQGVDRVEVIVVENGSSDATANIVSTMRRSYPFIRLVRSASRSAATAREEGVAIAKGEYLVFADSDDIVPDGAYQAMLNSLEASGSDMAIGNHLKFSASRTWSPTERWHRFDQPRSRVAPNRVPELLSGRACWNRMFRRSFWDRAELRFPQIASVEDIQPMTRAFVVADAIDVVAACVYLYRDRGDVSSMSVRADSAGTARYFQQEALCAALAHDDPVLRSQHAEIVLDADGWAHLQRFLSTDPDNLAIAEVASATAAVLAVIPLDRLDAVAPIRRALWLLVLAGEWSAARDFVLGTSSESATDRLGAWIDALRLLTRTSPAAAKSLARGGLVPAIVNEADGVASEWIAERLPLLSGLELDSSGAVLPDAMIAALNSEDVDGIMKVSRLRHVVPFLVDRAEATAEGLVIGGPANHRARGLSAVVELIGPNTHRSEVAIDHAAGRWRSELVAEPLAAGRYTARVSFSGIEGRFPIITARMPLPPVDERFPLQPLADRKDGWSFLVDRREPRHLGFDVFLKKVVRLLR